MNDATSEGLRLGDLVKLKAENSPEMVVTGVGTDLPIMGYHGDQSEAVSCTWIDRQGRCQAHVFNPAVLRRSRGGA